MNTENNQNPFQKAENDFQSRKAELDKKYPPHKSQHLLTYPEIQELLDCII